MELLKLPNEEFKEDFRNWLIEQSPKNFKTLSGYEILKSYYFNKVYFYKTKETIYWFLILSNPQIYIKYLWLNIAILLN